METAHKVEAYIPEWQHDTGVPYHPGSGVDLKICRPNPKSVPSLTKDEAAPKAEGKKLVNSLKQPFICLSVLIIAYTFTYSTLHAIVQMFSR